MRVMMPRRVGLTLIVLIAWMAYAAGCMPGAPKGEVIVYVAVPLSGWQAEGGQTLAGGVRLMASELNQAGGLLGYAVNVIAVDDEADPDTAIAVAEEVKAAIGRGERVLGVIGHYNSGETSAAMEIYRDLPVIVVTATASDVSITERGYTNFCRVNATDAAQAPVDARFLVETLGAQRIALAYANNDYGRGLFTQMSQALKDLGVSPVVSIEIEEAATTQANAVERIKAATPDAVFLAGYETEGYVLLPELREAGVDAPFMCSDGCLPYAFIDESGPAAEGAYVSGITPDPQAVSDEQWFKAYQEVEYRNPGTYSTAGYSAMAVLAEAARQAKSFERSAVASALHSLRYDTLVGRVAYDQKGDLMEQNVYVFQVQDGRYVQVQPAP
jgi:branched-chain amino acid transport system substrate-binding protein